MSSSFKASEPAAPRLPRRFGPYLLFDLIGQGGMAEIYLAQAETELGGRRLCVVKQILPSLVAHGQFAEMLIHEAKLAVRLDHTNIVKVIDLGRVGEELYIAMEYVEGFDLSDLLRRCTKLKIPMPLDFGLGVVCAVLRGLDYAHRRTSESGAPLGIVHRDVSPSNVLVSYDGEIKLCDFGIAVANPIVLDTAAAALTSEALQGKAGYMSPEHARGEAIDARADVFAAGILAWELVAGRRLYRKDAGPSLLEQARRAEIPPLPPRGIADEARLHAIIARALASSRDDRYPSAAAMLREIEAYVSAANLVASPLRFGGWLEASFGTEMVTRRRARQRAAEALAKGPPVVLTPLPPAPRTPPPPVVVPPHADLPPSSTETPDAPPPASPGAAAAPRSRRTTWVAAGVALALALAYALLHRGP